MKLELKHLSPYLPYKLQLISDGGRVRGMGTDYVLKELETDYGIGQVIKFQDMKPILRPLSDLTKEIEVNGVKFLPHRELERDEWVRYVPNDNWSCITSENINKIEHRIFVQLSEWHFDVFGLIGKGLAIDINELS